MRKKVEGTISKVIMRKVKQDKNYAATAAGNLNYVLSLQCTRLRGLSQPEYHTMVLHVILTREHASLSH
jgi:hypothetical protein